MNLDDVKTKTREMSKMLPWTQERSIGIGSIFALFVGGAVVGAAVALLFAPVPGTESRRKIKEYVNKGLDTVSRSSSNGIRKPRTTTDQLSV